MSVPGPPTNVSAPVPPTNTSLPEPPLRTLGRPLPVNLSLLEDPVMFSTSVPMLSRSPETPSSAIPSLSAITGVDVEVM